MPCLRYQQSLTLSAVSASSADRQAHSLVSLGLLDASALPFVLPANTHVCHNSFAKETVVSLHLQMQDTQSRNHFLSVQIVWAGCAGDSASKRSEIYP